jgi:putative ABC transport system permease protein
MKKDRFGSARFRLKAGLRTFRFWLWLIRVIGVIVPRRLRADWRQEWGAELRYRESLLTQWDKLDRRAKLDLLWHSAGAFADALWLQPRRLEEEMFQDLRYGVRMLLKRPGYSLLALIALAIGIGPVTAIFSLINGLLLRPLPYNEPDRLMTVWRSLPQRGFHEYPVSGPTFLYHRERNQVFSQVSAFVSDNLSIGGEGEPERIEGAYVSAEFFSTLGAQPALGRGFEPHEERPGAAPVVVISHALWRNRFGADPNALGKSLLLDGRSYQIVGVAPAGQEFPIKAQLWTPLNLDPQQLRPGSNFLSMIGRLKPGVTVERAQAQWNEVAAELERQDPQYNAGARIEMIPLEEHATGAIKRPLFLLFGAIGLVLLIACANVANLTLARASGRERELAVRAALGASRLRLIRQLLTESLALAAMGATLGALIAGWTRDLLVGLNPFKISRLYTSDMDWRALCFTAALALLTSVVFGLIPALQCAGRDLAGAIKEGMGGASGAAIKGRLRGALVVVEVSLSLALLIGAGLLIRSFLSLRAVDPGFNPEGVLTLDLTLPQPAYADQNKRLDFIRQTTERLRAIPGVESVASAAYVPMSEMNTSRRFAVAERPLPEPGKEPFAREFPVSSTYFGLLGVPLRAGRIPTEQETQASLALIVNESFAQRFFPGENAVGKRMRFYSASPQGPPPPWIEIAGVVGDVNQTSLSDKAEPIIYTPQTLRAWSFMSFMVRTKGDPASLANAARLAVYGVDKTLAVSKVATLEEVVTRTTLSRRGLMTLLGAFAAVALLLATVGIYGVLSYTVSLRTREIGVRMALGAERRDVMKLVIGQGMAMTLAGVVCGLGAAYGLTRLLKDMLYGVGERDPLTFVVAPLLLAGVALVSCYIPARRATKVDPLVALRSE